MTQYVVAQSRNSGTFFTSSSAYDRPKWLPLSEATVYQSAELAQRAAVKLATHAHYSAVAIPLAEAMPPEPELNQNDLGDTDAPPADEELPTDDQPSDEASDREMQAADQEDVCATCKHEPCTCPSDEEGDAGDDQLSTDDPTAVDQESGDLPPDDSTVRRMGESVEEMKFSDSATVPATGDDVSANEGKIVVPKSTITELVAAISKAEKQVKQDDNRNDTSASFHMTVVDALTQLKDHLTAGTSESLKSAQILFTSLMSPIQYHVPDEAKRIILSGGARPSLKDMFNVKLKEAATSLEQQLKDAEEDLRDMEGSLVSQEHADAIDDQRAKIKKLKTQIANRSK